MTDLETIDIIGAFCTFPKNMRLTSEKIIARIQSTYSSSLPRHIVELLTQSSCSQDTTLIKFSFFCILAEEESIIILIRSLAPNKEKFDLFHRYLQLQYSNLDSLYLDNTNVTRAFDVFVNDLSNAWSMDLIHYMQSKLDERAKFQQDYQHSGGAVGESIRQSTFAAYLRDCE